MEYYERNPEGDYLDEYIESNAIEEYAKQMEIQPLLNEANYKKVFESGGAKRGRKLAALSVRFAFECAKKMYRPTSGFSLLEYIQFCNEAIIEEALTLPTSYPAWRRRLRKRFRKLAALKK